MSPLTLLPGAPTTPPPPADLAEGRRTPPPPAPARSVLIVDDEAPLRALLTRAFRNWGFEPHAVDSGHAALALLEQRRFTLMLCDQRMPELTGLETVSAALGRDPELAVVMLSAVNEAGVATEAFNRGAFDYVTKPFDLDAIRDVAMRALHRRDRAIHQRRTEEVIREEVAQRTEALQYQQEALRAMSVGVVETLINAMEAKDVYLRGHSQRVADLAASIAHALGMDEDEVEHVRLAGRLHDVGKIGIREAVLNKPDRLTSEEYAHVREHVRIGMEILGPLAHIDTALAYVQDHHEHWDGSGYPRGLTGDEITLGGRILAAADTFDALTSRRAYREPLTAEDTVAFMDTLSGVHIDPEVYLALRGVVLDRRALLFLDVRHG